ncbi:MAG: PilN domain-containing protein [Candidatus Omnitrophica bacterium]|nr:PilN domain-containing protein [Candidatus Omnitrophota bacterium]
MIEINLVPIHLRKKENLGVGVLKSINLPKEIILGVGGIFITFLVFIHLVLIGGYVVKFIQQLVYKDTWQRMVPDKNNVDSIGKEIKDLRSKLSTIGDITTKKALVWSQKLNILSDVAPKGIWFRRIIWDNKILIIEGSAYSKLHDEITVVGSFVTSLKKDVGFSKDFIAIELNSISRIKKGIAEVVEFKITAKTK